MFMLGLILAGEAVFALPFHVARFFRLIDASPGLAGHQHFFFFLAAFAAIGVITSFALMRMLHPGESRTITPPA